MSIDWFTFTAQIVNFLILVLLLRRFLYGPIVRAMEKREAKIAEQLRQAEQSRQEGEQLVEQYQQKVRAADQQREELLRDARQDADQERRRLMAEAREHAQRKRQEWFQSFEREREELLAQLQLRAGQLSVEAARRTLAELADESLEQRMFAAFTSRLQELDDQRRREIQGFLGNGEAEVFVRSAFEVSDSWRDRLQAAVRQQFGYQGSIDFERSPDLICGIELEAGGYSLGWNVHEFLRNMEAGFDERLKAEAAKARR